MCRSVEIYSLCLVLQSYGNYSLARNVHKQKIHDTWIRLYHVLHLYDFPGLKLSTFFSLAGRLVYEQESKQTPDDQARWFHLSLCIDIFFNKSVVEPATTLMRWKQSILVTLWIYMDLYGFIFNFEYLDIDVMSPLQVEIMGIQPEVLHGCQVADHLTGKWRLTLSRPWFVGLFHIFFQHKVSTAYHYLSLLFCDSISTFVAHFFKSRG